MGDKVGAVVLLPFLMVVILIVFIPQLVLYGRIFFIQERPGLQGEIFKLYKLQTMKQGEGKDKERMTLFGGLLRKTGIDELPQIINILKGEMSFVGPRPLLSEYLALYNDNHKKRHNVLPGITGLTQVNGDKISSWKDKLDFDLEYVNSISFYTDLKIIVSTIKLLLFKAGKEKEFIEGKFTGYEY